MTTVELIILATFYTKCRKEQAKRINTVGQVVYQYKQRSRLMVDSRHDAKQWSMPTLDCINNL
jgi:hypothetical protein